MLIQNDCPRHDAAPVPPQVPAQSIVKVNRATLPLV
jgi:hypothetical protein